MRCTGWWVVTGSIADPLRVKQMLSEVDRVRVSPSACLSQTGSWCYPTTNFFLSRNALDRAAGFEPATPCPPDRCAKICER